MSKYSRERYLKHREVLLAKQKAYYWDNREEILRRSQVFRGEHGVEINARRKTKKYQETRSAWMIATREKRKQYRKAYWEAHKDVQGPKNKSWADAHPELMRSYAMVYRATHRDRILAWSSIRRGAPGVVNAWMIDRIYGRFGNTCVYCGGPSNTLDHFIPIKRGGPNAEWNLVPACKKCNSSKNASEPFSWMMKKGVRFDIRAQV